MEHQLEQLEDELGHHSVELRAYRLWEERGRPWGTPEEDWFEAESEIRAAHQAVEPEPPTITAAKAVGSVLGSVAGLVTSLAHALTLDSES
jgi:hypothetical protein